MKTLYLHIGTPKTATTAIQKFCSENESVLNRYGYTYPDFEIQYEGIGKRRNGHFLVGELRKKPEERDFETENQIAESCFAKIYALFREYDNVILSDEGIWGEGMKFGGRLWKNIQKEEEKGVFEVRVIVYLRRQDEFLYSWWRQQIKKAYDLTNPKNMRDWQQMLESYSRRMVHYDKMLGKIAGYVGREQIIVRRFAGEHFYGGTIYSDFLNVLGLQFSDQYQIQKDVRNISLTPNFTEIKRILNSLPENDERCNNIFHKCLVDCSSECSDDRRYSMFSQEELRNFMSEFEKGNRKVAEEYLGVQEDLFDSGYKAEMKWTKDNSAMLDDVLRFTGTMIIYLLKDNQKLKEMVEQREQGSIAQLKQMLKYPADTMEKVKHIFQGNGQSIV